MGRHLWPLALTLAVYAGILLSASYYLGGVRVERVVGFVYNFVKRSPSLHCVGRNDTRFRDALDENPTLAIYWQQWINVRSGLYYESSEFAGPLRPTDLKVQFTPGTLEQGEDAFAILVRQSGEPPEKMWLKTRVTSIGELTVSVPAFAGRARIWLFVASDNPLTGTTNWTTREHTQ